MKELGEYLAKVGVGGYYRRTISLEGVTLKGPYKRRNQADPFYGARLPAPLSITSEFHLRRPKNVLSPDPSELKEIK